MCSCGGSWMSNEGFTIVVCVLVFAALPLSSFKLSWLVKTAFPFYFTSPPIAVAHVLHVYCITWWRVLRLYVYEVILGYFYYTTRVDAEFYLTKLWLQNNLIWSGQDLTGIKYFVNQNKSQSWDKSGHAAHQEIYNKDHERSIILMLSVCKYRKTSWFACSCLSSVRVLIALFSPWLCSLSSTLSNTIHLCRLLSSLAERLE